MCLAEAHVIMAAMNMLLPLGSDTPLCWSDQIRQLNKEVRELTDKIRRQRLFNGHCGFISLVFVLSLMALKVGPRGLSKGSR